MHGLNVWRWALLGALVGLLGLAGAGAQAATYSSVCAGCHATGSTTTPPLLPSQGFPSPFEAPAVDFTDECLVTTNCALRNAINAFAAMNGVSALFNNSDLEAVRVYLLRVRDGQVSNTSASFNATLIGQTDDATVSVTVSNSRGDFGGVGGSVNYAFSVTGTDFSLVSPVATQTCGPTGNLSANDCTKVVTVRFTPSAGGTRTGALHVTVTPENGADPNPSDKSISLSATGVIPTPGYSQSTNLLSFTTKLGTSTSQSVTISNPVSATANLVLANPAFSFSRAEYTRSGASTCNNSTSLAPGSSCVLTVVFTPSVAGAANGSVTISHNAASSPDSVTLNGTGTQSTITSSSTSLAFSNVQLGVPKALPAITISNTGTASLTFTADPLAAAALTGTGKSDYAVTGTCHNGTILAAGGGSCTLTVTFTPSVLGPRPATLTLTSDATNGNPLAITLTGTGVSLPEPVVTYPATNFPDTVIGETSAQTRQITIVNDRTRDITYSVANTTDFKVGSESCAGHVVTGGGGTCTVNLQFMPTLGSGEGLRTANIVITFAGTLGDPAPSSTSGAVAGQALLPIALSATSLNPAAVVGSPTTVSAVLTNRSASGVALTDFVFSGAAATDYSLDASNTCIKGTTLAAGNACSLVIRFAPAAAGARDATLTITHGALGSPQTITLHGTATPAPQGQIALSALSLSFADTQLGSTSAQTVTVQNVGNLALNFSAFTAGGANAADFERSGTCAVGTPLAINAQCTLIITFRPSALGARSGTLTISSDASNGAATLSFTGTGVPVPAPVVSFAPTSLSFGAQTVGGLYPKRLVRLSNAGTADLAIASIVVQGAGFTNASAAPCPATLAPGAGCDIEVLFTPTAAGTTYNGNIVVTSNAAGSPHSAPLSGTGTASAVAVLVWSPAVTSLDFGNVTAGTVSATQSVTLLNQGPGGVNLTVLNAVGADGAMFSVTAGTCQIGVVIFEGQTCRIDVTFAPAAAGARTASVQIASTGSFPPTLTLTGTGLGGPAPGLAVSAATLSFGDTRVGAQSIPAEIRLSSNGSGVVRVMDLAVSGPYAVQSNSCPSVPFSLAAGSECSVTVTFVPQAEGSAAGALQVTTDASPASREVALSGNGAAKADVSSGGCSIASGEAATDPTLWLLVLLALAALLYRHRARSARQRADQSGREST